MKKYCIVYNQNGSQVREIIKGQKGDPSGSIRFLPEERVFDYSPRVQIKILNDINIKKIIQ